MRSMLVALPVKGQKTRSMEEKVRSAWIPDKEPTDDYLERLGPKLDNAWQEEIQQQGLKKASLWRALIRAFGKRFFFAAFWEIIGKCVFGVMVAITLGLLVGDIQQYGRRQLLTNQPVDNDITEDKRLSSWNWKSLEAIIVYKSLLLFAFMCCNIFSSQYYLFNSTYVGMKCRLACTYLIYRKALRISLLTLETTTSGQIVNLITNDVTKFDGAFYYLQYMYIAPLQATVVFILLSSIYMGLAATALGFTVVIIYLCIQVYLGRSYGRLRTESNSKSDGRFRTMGEIIDSIGIIKMYAWESYFERSVTELRKVELTLLDQVSTLRAVNLSLFYGACKLILMVIFVAFVLMGYTFNTVKVFTAITMTNSMRSYLTLFFPYSVAQLSELKISIERIRQFLIQDELESLPSTTSSPSLLSAQLNHNRRQQLTTVATKLLAKNHHHLSRRHFVLITPEGPTRSLPSMQKNSTTPSASSALPSISDSRQTTVKASSEQQQQQQQVNCRVCAKFDHNHLLIDRKFAVMFHEVTAAWPKSSPDSEAVSSQQSQQQQSVQQPQKSSQQTQQQQQQQQQLQPDSTTIFNNLTAHIKHHEFVMIVGRVGAGKSSLLMSILNELPIQAGTIQVNGSLAYASQEPWIFAGTLRENITIAWHKQTGRDYRQLPPRLERRYQEVLRICCLNKDLENLPKGDLTVVGERGTSLSGGQKARVNLARALFYDADIYLLDDPLSAVDSSVAKYIFDECFKTFLRRKTVLLVTHQVQFSTPAQKVLLLHDSPDFSYGPATRVLHNLFKQYNLDPKAVIPSGANEESAVVPVTVNESPPSGPLGEIDSNSLTAMTSDEIGQVNSDGSASLLLWDSLSPKSLEQSELEPQPQLTKLAQKSPLKSPSLRLLAEVGFEAGAGGSGQSSPANCGTYLYYRKRAASIWLIIVFLLANFMTQILFNGTDYFLSEWSDSEERRSLRSSSVDNFWDRIELKYMCAIYLLIITLLLTASFARNMIFFRACSKASEAIHRETLHGVIYAPMSFFDQNSIGSILARFSTDLDTLDDLIPQSAIDVIEIFTNIIGIIIVTALISIYNVVPALIMLLVANYFRTSCEPIITQLKQLEAVRRGHVFSYIVSTLHGLTTIRVFKLESVINRRFERAQNEHTSTWYKFLAGRHRLTVAIDAACMIYFFVVITITLFSVFLGFIEATLVGLLISQAVMLPGPFQWGMRQLIEVESQMTSVQRIREFSDLKPEEEEEQQQSDQLSLEIYQKREVKQLGKQQTTKQVAGEVRFVNVNLSYLPDEPAVLFGLNFTIAPRERVGVVGRTGAGKSSIVGVLFRLYKFDGQVQLDGRDTKTMPLCELRRSMSIIPQDPILFGATIRKNLDPFCEYSDKQLWDSLEAVQLKALFSRYPEKLEFRINEGGANFSVGQRQLICLARAIVRRNPILVLDEATANVDPETDVFIQRTISSQFAHCTVITIAHRLITIVDSDRVLVLDRGRVREFASPYELLSDSSSLFAQMVDSSAQQAPRLRERIQAEHERRQAALAVANTAHLNSVIPKGKATSGS